MPDGTNKAIMSSEMLKSFVKEKDFLIDMFKKKNEYLVMLDNDITKLKDVKEKEYQTKDTILAITSEMSELMDWINWKHWKKAEYPINETEIKFEIMDILHFVINLCIIWDMKPQDIYNYFMSKTEENINRQKRGY